MQFLRYGVPLMVFASVSLARAEESPADALMPESVRASIAKLNDPDFKRREAAVDELFALGIGAVFPLREAAENGSAEVSVRAFDVLQRLYRGDDEPTFEAVEHAFRSLKRADNLAIAARAERAFESGAETRQIRAIAQFERMGGIINFAERTSERQSFGRPRIENIFILRDWTGGDAGLQLLTRIEDLRNSHSSIYFIRGVQISEEAKGNLAAELPFMQFVIRGPARLGVKWNSQRDDGCIINEVDPDSAAEKAGLRKNDQVTEIDGQEVTSFDGLVKIIETKEPGDRIPIVFQRGSETHAVIAELSPWQRPKPSKP